MFLNLSLLLNFILLFYFLTQAQNRIQVLFLKSQLAAYKRKAKKFQTTAFQRLIFIFFTYIHKQWKDDLVLVTPNTVLKWRKRKFKIFWTLISKTKKIGRPMIPWDTIKLIRRISKENQIWGATKLHGLLLKLGYHISERTVSKYIPKRPTDPKKRLRWKQFYHLHSDSIIVSDTLSVFSANFKEIYRIIFSLHIGSREILHFDIHTNPTTRWIRKVLKFAIRKIGKSNVQYFVSDNESIFGKRLSEYLQKLGITHKRTAIRCPWQNGYAERWVKTARNEFLDYFIPANEYHLRKNLGEFIHFYNHYRTHLALDKNTPIASPVLEKPPDAKLISTPILGGLYHTYSYDKAA